MLGRSFHTWWRSTDYPVYPQQRRRQHPNLERLICAAISNRRFAAELVQAPARALAQSEVGRRLSAAERRLVLSISAAEDIYDFAGRLHALATETHTTDSETQLFNHTRPSLSRYDMPQPMIKSMDFKCTPRVFFPLFTAPFR